MVFDVKVHSLLGSSFSALFGSGLVLLGDPLGSDRIDHLAYMLYVVICCYIVIIYIVVWRSIELIRHAHFGINSYLSLGNPRVGSYGHPGLWEAVFSES